MADSTTLTFSGVYDYQGALRGDGALELVVSGRGAFRAELTRIELRHTRIVGGAENLARIAYLSLPQHMVRIVLPARSGSSICDGVATDSRTIIAYGPGRNVHERTEAASHWRTIWLPAQDLHGYGMAMLGRNFDMPIGVCRWRPARAALNRLSQLHDDATQMSATQPNVIADPEATRGLEEELIMALIDCLSGKPVNEETIARIRHASVMDRFQRLLREYPHRPPSIADICAAIKVPLRSLRACCELSLGMGPHRYLHLRRMQGARYALCHGGPEAPSISSVARRYGFTAEGRFAEYYRQLFDELPSAVVRRRRSA